MSYRAMLRLAGLAAMVGGAIWALASLQQFLNLASPDLLNVDRSIGGNNVVFARYVLQPIGVALLALGLVGLYARQARATGIPGLIGFLLAFFGTAIVYAGYWSILLAYLGWALFGASSLKARVYPRLASVLLIVGALTAQLFNPSVAVGPGASFGYVGALGTIVVTVVIAWLGFILFTERAEEAQRLAAQTSPTLLRLAGLAAVVGGVLVVLLDLVQFAKLGFPDVGLIPYETSNVTITIVWVQQNLGYFGLAAVALGLVGLYLRLDAASPTRGAGILMLIGFVLASGGTLLQLHLEETSYWAVMLACLGWILFGIYSLRARIYPRLALILLIVSSLVQAVTSPIVIYRLVGFLGEILGEDVVGDDPSYYLYVGGGESTLIVYLGALSEIGLYIAVAWLGFSLLSYLRGAQAEQRRPERAGATTSTFGGLGAAVLIVGLLPIVLLLIPGFREQSGLSGARASVSDDTNPACPPEDRTLEGVWGGSSRLIMHDPCRRMVADVVQIEGPNADGDMDIWISPDPGYTALVGSPQNIENGRRYRFGGSFSIEPGPRDGRTTDPETGEEGPPHLPLPNVGDKVDVWGAYVFDSSHGYYEIHPVFSISISSDGGNTWEGPYTSGPRFGGALEITSYAGNPWTLCRDENNNPCLGYEPYEEE
jgi:hypothetical protein